jgi:manganese-dependent inorganic pyrophosphatase
MSEVLVIGHRNPDTDSICSAIGYAEFKRRTGMPEAVAARCGDTNERIDFVLGKFGVEPPRFVTDVSPRVRDVMQDRVVSVPPGTAVAEAITMMDEGNLRVLPVLTEAGVCTGLLSVFKVGKFFLTSPRTPKESRRVWSTIRRVTRTLGGKMLFAVEPDREENLTLMIGAMSLASFRERMELNEPQELVVVVGDRADIQETAIKGRVRVLIITGGHAMEEALLHEARKYEVSIVLSPHDSASTAMLCRASLPVDRMVHEEFPTFRPDEPLVHARRLATESRFQAFPVVDDQGKTVGLITKSDFLKPVQRRLILVDHNELTQAVAGADEVEILEIIDHHRIGAFTSHQPILFRNEPVGSTSTIVADCFLRYRVELPEPIAGLLLAGLVSDTLNLTSPTTTERDVEILGWLEQRSGLDATTFTEALFASGSLLQSRPPEEAITSDCKEYVEGSRTFSVAQIEEIGFELFHRRKREIREALSAYRQRGGYFFSALFVTDVVQQKSLLMLAATESLLRQISHPEVEIGIYALDGIVSRKKQLLPYLTHCLGRIR